MRAVSNTSPIVFLAKIDALGVLVECFDKISVPQAVVSELRDLPLPGYIEPATISATGDGFVRGALGRLHRGELEAMVLTQECGADYVLLDDLLARRKAQRLRLKPMGTVGVLLLAWKRQVISARDVEQGLLSLTQEHGMYLSPGIMAKVRRSLRKPADG